MTRHYGLGGETTQQKAARLESSRLPPTLDRRTRRRLLLIGGMFCLAFGGLAFVIVLMLAGVLSW